MAQGPNHFVSGKQLQKGHLGRFGLFKGQMATLRPGPDAIIVVKKSLTLSYSL